MKIAHHNVQKPRKKKTKISKVKVLCFSIFLISAACFLGSKLFLHSASSALALENQTITEELSEHTAAIEQLKGDITQLQDKNRVLGMLEGQVSDNEGNVYYYQDN